MSRAIAVTVFLSALAVSPVSAAERPAGRHDWCGTTAHGTVGAVYGHHERQARYGNLRQASAGSAAVTRSGQIAVVSDDGDLARPRNLPDLRSMNLRFSPQGSGYVVSRVDQALQAVGGTPLALGDDDTRAVTLPFAFPMFGQARSDAFVNSDGNITFGAGDGESTSRDLGRFLGGPPRVAGMLMDLDPTAGGTVTFEGAAERATVTWTAVPRYGENDQNTFQITLWADGRIDLTYSGTMASTVDEAVAGVAPGAAEGGYTGIDLSSAAAASGPAAIGETFRSAPSLDTVAVARKFYSAFPDDYDQLIVFTTQKLTDLTTFAYEQTVKNTIAGIGSDGFDYSADYGSGGRLESFVLMDNVGKYPADPAARFLSEDSALTLVAHESGHRWLTQATFLDNGSGSAALLGRQGAHWSFFFDSDGSFLEGNNIDDLGGGSFRTSGASLRYSALDQYLMGLRAAEEVPPFFYVSAPSGTGQDPESNPMSNVTFNGTRRDVTIDNVIASIGPRVPSVADSPKVWRQAWILVAPGGAATPEQLAQLETLRAAWEPFWTVSTEGRGTVEARLD